MLVAYHLVFVHHSNAANRADLINYDIKNQTKLNAVLKCAVVGVVTLGEINHDA